MKIRNIGASVLRNLKNIPGWTTHRKIVVIESDDWGSIRIPSATIFEKFKDFGFDVQNSQYNRLDALESNDDLNFLFEVLGRFKDSRGNSARLTANTIIANPDFKKIKDSNFQSYHFEHFRETLKRYPNHDQVFKLYEYGMNEKLFQPQFHGREHLNVNRWMRTLRQGSRELLFAFDQETTFSGKGDYSFMEALDLDLPSDLGQVTAIVQDGLAQFKETFGYSSKSFIAPCYTWDSRIEETLVNGGVEYLQGGMFQYEPKAGFENYKKRYHYIGEKNESNLIYMVRNVAFEPSLVFKTDWVDYTLAGIRDAFRWKKPAIICSHRINFIGFLDPTNRDQNLKLLSQLLATIVKRWPEVEFMSSDELGDLMKGNTAQ